MHSLHPPCLEAFTLAQKPLSLTREVVLVLNPLWCVSVFLASCNSMERPRCNQAAKGPGGRQSSHFLRGHPHGRTGDVKRETAPWLGGNGFLKSPAAAFTSVCPSINPSLHCSALEHSSALTSLKIYQRIINTGATSAGSQASIQLPLVSQKRSLSPMRDAVLGTSGFSGTPKFLLCLK